MMPNWVQNFWPTWVYKSQEFTFGNLLIQRQDFIGERKLREVRARLSSRGEILWQLTSPTTCATLLDNKNPLSARPPRAWGCMWIPKPASHVTKFHHALRLHRLIICWLSFVPIWNVSFLLFEIAFGVALGNGWDSLLKAEQKMEKLLLRCMLRCLRKRFFGRAFQCFHRSYALQSKLDDKWTTYSSHSTLYVRMCLLLKFFSLIFMLSESLYMRRDFE